MVFYPWERFLDAGLVINDMGTQIAEAGRKFGCRLWRSYPDSWTRSTPEGSPARQFWNSACNPPDPPLLPDPPGFTGGQCDFRYNLQVDVAVYPSTINCDRPGDPIQDIFVVAWGPISFVSLDQPAGICGGFNRVFCVCHGNGAFAREPNPVVFPLAFGSLGRFESIRSITVSPQSGQPDTCGDPPPTYPPDTPPAPGSETFNVTFETDTTNSLSFDLIWNRVEFSLPVTFDFDQGNVTINFDGIDVDLAPGNNWGIEPPRRDFEPTALPTPAPNTDNYEQEVKPVEDSGEEEIGIEIAYITLTLTTKPVNAKTQFGGNAPDVFYAGWFEFRTEGFFYVRQPIHWENSIFIPPKGATGYAYTLYTGFSGIISTYKLKV